MIPRSLRLLAAPLSALCLLAVAVPAALADPAAAPVITSPVTGAYTNDGNFAVVATGIDSSSDTETLYIDGLFSQEINPQFITDLHPGSLLTSDDSGTHTLTVTQSTAGVKSAVSAPVDIIFDQIPTVTAPAEYSVTNDSTPAIALTGAIPGQDVSVELTNDGFDHTYSATADSSGNASVPVTDQLADGGYSIAATTLDSDNKASDPSYSYFDVDTTAPDAPQVASPADGGLVNDSTPEIDVQVSECPAAVSLVIDQRAPVTVTTDDNCDAVYQPTTPLDDGPHTITVTETDEAGNTSAPATTGFTVDTVAPPAPTITSPENGSVSYGSYPSIGVQAQVGDTVNMTIDGQDPAELWTNDSGYAETVPSDALADGSHTVRVTATDPAGNTGLETTSTFTVDTSEHADPTPVATTPQASTTPPVTTTPAVIAPVTVKPAVQPLTPLAAAMAHLRFRAPKAGVSARHPGMVRIDLGHQRATVTLTVRRKVGKGYRTAATAKLKNRTGKLTYKLTAKVGGHTLKPGAYQLVVQGTSHNKKSGPVVHGFRVAKPAHATH
jgi:large repetitive protein